MPSITPSARSSCLAASASGARTTAPGGGGLAATFGTGFFFPKRPINRKKRLGKEYRPGPGPQKTKPQEKELRCMVGRERKRETKSANKKGTREWPKRKREKHQIGTKIGGLPNNNHCFANTTHQCFSRFGKKTEGEK